MRIGTGLQNKLLEAMAMNLPCVTSSLAAGAMGAQHGVECLIADDAADVADKIVDLLTNETRRIQLCEQARVLLEQNFSWEGTVQKLSLIIRESGEGRS
jgi:glycosyltransferase involved in cell wall biosynthesis